MGKLRASRVPLALILLLAGVIAAANVVGCGSDETGSAVLSIDAVLAAETGQRVAVQGHLVAGNDGMVLASALLESYPPQAGGSVLSLEGLDLAQLVGLSSTVERPELSQVTWSDYPVVLEGVMEGGTLMVERTPAVTEGRLEAVKVRFSAVREGPTAGDPVWWVFDLINLSTQPLTVTFASGLMADAVLTRSGVEAYRWSRGKVFTQATFSQTIGPGRSFSIVLNDVLHVPPGQYELAAKVTATIGPESACVALPEVATSFTVR